MTIPANSISSVNTNNSNKMRGRIKSLKRNHGFVGGHDGHDYFFYWTFLSPNTKTFNQLAVGTTVEFVPETVDGRRRAQNIIAID